MPSDILRGGNGTTDAIVTILARLGLWEVPHLENVLLQWLQLLDFELSGCHLAPYPSKVFNHDRSWIFAHNSFS